MLIVPIDNNSRHSHSPALESMGNSTGTRFRETLRQAAAVANIHAVRRGDTLSEIVAAALRAEGRAVSRRAIYEGVSRVAMANGIANPDRIFVGQRIDLSALNAQRSAEAAPKRSNTPGAIPSNPNANLTQPIEPTMRAMRPQSVESLIGGSSRVSSEYGTRPDPFTGRERHHHGIDLAARRGSPIYPLFPGEVVSSGWRSGYGNAVLIRHGNGLETFYAHNSQNLVKAGDRVSHDTALGLVGTTGRSTGNHLHFEVRRGGMRIDPAPFFEERPGFGERSGL